MITLGSDPNAPVDHTLCEKKIAAKNKQIENLKSTIATLKEAGVGEQAANNAIIASAVGSGLSSNSPNSVGGGGVTEKIVFKTDPEVITLITPNNP